MGSGWGDGVFCFPLERGSRDGWCPSPNPPRPRGLIPLPLSVPLDLEWCRPSPATGGDSPAEGQLAPAGQKAERGTLREDTLVCVPGGRLRDTCFHPGALWAPTLERKLVCKNSVCVRGVSVGVRLRLCLLLFSHGAVTAVMAMVVVVATMTIVTLTCPSACCKWFPHTSSLQRTRVTDPVVTLVLQLRKVKH